VCKGTGSVSAEKSHFTSYPDRSLENARELMRCHGEPVEICIAGNHDIRVVFRDGSRYILGGFTVGYRGTGPDYTKAFLQAAGFDISIDEIAEMRPPVTLVDGQPYIPAKSVILEAPTLLQAKTKAQEAVPPNAKFIALEVIRDGTPETVEGEGISKEAAIEAAKAHLPEGVDIDEEGVVHKAQEGILAVQAYSDGEARDTAQRQLPPGAVIQEIVCTQAVSKALLGFRHRAGTYEISWRSPCKAALTYRQPAAVRIRFQPSSR
jgi:hypothetical protein